MSPWRASGGGLLRFGTPAEGDRDARGGYERKNLQVTHPARNLEKGDFVDLHDLVPYLESKAEELREL
jgi:hypothetical protein